MNPLTARGYRIPETVSGDVTIKYFIIIIIIIKVFAEYQYVTVQKFKAFLYTFVSNTER